MAQSYTPTTFAVAVLQGIGAPITRQNVQAMVGWQKAEGGHWNNDARYNPLNTTMKMPGAGNTGTQGNIKVYTSWQQGLDATVKTLKNGLYGNILGALKRGNNPAAVGAAIGNSPWCPGCGPYATRVILQTKVGKVPAVTTPAVMGPLATPKPQITLASQAKATPPSVSTTLVPRTVEPDTSFQGAIQQLASQQQPQTTPASTGFDPGYSSVLSGRPAPVPQSTGFVPGQAQGIGSQIAGLSQLVGPSTFLDTKTTVTPGKVTPGKTVTPTDGRNTGQTTPSLLPEHHSGLLELIHKSASGPGFGVKDGKLVNGSQVFSDVWDGHAGHVHVAAGPNTIVDVGKMAQAMGLHVSENPHFGGVNPVHVPGSYHYKGEAIDVSGSPKQMDAFAREVEQAFGLIGGTASTGAMGQPSSPVTTKAKPGLPVANYTGLVQGNHQTSGLDGFPAKDYGAPAGSAVVAPVAGTVYKLSGSDPAGGPQGPGKALGWTVYIRGTDGREYFITHLGSRSAHVGEAVKQGTRIGTVADFEKYGVPNHIHMGVHG